MRIDALLEHIRSKSLLHWIRLFAVAVLALVLLYLFTTYRILSVHVALADGISDAVSLQAVIPGREPASITRLGSTALLHKDTSSIIASTNTYSTIKELPPLSLFSIPSVEITIHKDKNATKYSGDSLGCTAYGEEQDRLLTYHCGRPNNLVTYEHPTNPAKYWSNTLVASMAPAHSAVYSVKPFAEGVLALQVPRLEYDASVHNYLLYTQSSGKQQHLTTPDTIAPAQLSSISIVTDTTSNESNSVLLVDKFSKTLYFTADIFNENTNYQRADLPDSVGQFDTLSCKLLQKKVYCYSGLGTGAPDSEDETHHHEHAGAASLLVLDFENDSPQVQTASFPDTYEADQLYVTQANELYALSGRELSRLAIQKDTVRVSTYHTNVGSVSSGNGLYFTADNSLYYLDDTKKESYLVFRSSHLTLSSVVSLGEHTFINSYIKDSPSRKLHTYKLTDEPYDDPSQKRLIDLVPFTQARVISDIDFQGNTIRVRLYTSIISDKASGRTTFDEVELERNKALALDELAARGITPREYTIIFSN